MSRKKIEDGLTNIQRYRLKDLEAYRKYYREYAKTPKQKEYRKKYMEKWRKNNRDEYVKYCKERYIKDKELGIYKTEANKKRQRKWHLKVNYNLTEEQYNEILISQNNQCFICGKFDSEMKKRLAVDHDHETGKIRGLLCDNCNGSLGWYEKNKEKIRLYLEKYSYDKK